MSKKVTIRRGTSSHDGITLMSNRNKGYMAKAELTEDGIVTSYCKKDKKAKDTSEQKDYTWHCIFLFLGVAIIVTLIMLYIFERDSLIPYFWLFLCTTNTALVLILMNDVKKNMSIRKFHAAEHMVIAALKELQRIPSIEELKLFSRFSRYCTTGIITPLIAIPFGMFAILTAFPYLNYHGMNILILSPVLIVVELLDELKCSYLLQRITTSPATDKELEVAIACLQVWYNHETKKTE